MSILNAAAFGVVAALIVGGADYAIAMKKHAGQEYGLLDHIEFRMGAVMTGSGVAKALPRTSRVGCAGCNARRQFADQG